MTNQLERLAALGIELIPMPGLERHFVFSRDGFASLVERRESGFGRLGTSGLITEHGVVPATLQGIGPIGASAAVATVGDFKQFRHAAQFGAWIGLTPRQDSSGGKTGLGGITKRGDVYLRSLLIQGAKSAVMTAHKRSDPISQWVAALRDRAGWQKAVVALANKNARILWAVLTRDGVFDADHVPQILVARQKPATV